MDRLIPGVVKFRVWKCALEMPRRRIAKNAGKDGSVIVDGVLRQQETEGNTNIGYDVLAESFVDMVASGWIDPAKVTRGALENAASIAAMILTTEALITDLPEEAGPPAAPPMPEYSPLAATDSTTCRV